MKMKAESEGKGGSVDDNAGWLSYTLLAHLDPIFEVGCKRPLELKDLGEVSKHNRAKAVYGRFSTYFSRDKSAKRSMWDIIWKTVRYRRIALALILFAISAALQLGPVMILNRLVQDFEGTHDYNQRDVWILVALLFVFPVMCSLCQSHSNVLMLNIGIQVRNALIGAIYRKSMTVSPSERQKIGAGKIISMFSDDTNNLKLMISAIHNVVLAPLQIGALLYLIYQQVGPSVFVGLGYSVVSTPIAGIVMSMFFAYYKEKKTKSDLRVKLMNEVLNGIRIIKYYAWEDAFVEKIRQVRAAEVTLLYKMGYLFNTVFAFLLLGGPQFQTILIFLTYIGLGNSLDAATAFTTLTLFGIMTTPLLFISFGLQQISLATVSLGRIAQYLDAEDLGSYVENVDGNLHSNGAEMDSSVVVVLENAHLGWTKEADSADANALAAAPKKDVSAAYENVPSSEPVAAGSPEEAERGADEKQATKGDEEAPANSTRAVHTLVDINFAVTKGTLVGIVGSVGCGKSSILQALLGEMHLHRGRISMRSGLKVAFCDQRPWIVNATVKENILFGEEYDADRMQRALYASALEDDLRLLTAGIDTEIGERGVTLSGGQKARVALARAVYANADIYLLDDPLSAVDAHVGQHIFSQCLKQALANKTILLVTNQLHVLPACDQVVVLDDHGRMLTAGSYDDLARRGVDVAKFVQPVVSDASGADDAGTSDASAYDGSPNPPQNQVTKESGAKAVAEKPTTDVSKEGAAGKLMTDEERNDGDVPWSVYVTYFSYGGLMWFALTLLAQLANQGLQIGGNFWLSAWGEETSNLETDKGEEMSTSRSFGWFRGYAGLLTASVVMMSVSRILLTQHRLNAAVRFHEELLHRVLFLKMSFFDTTPVGRIVNRFAQDVATIDEELAQTMSQAISLFGSVFGSIGAIVAATKGTFLILLIPLMFIYNKWNTFFRKSNTAMARLEAVSRSPIYADFSQTLSGTSTIHAYRQEERFIETLEAFVDANSVPNLLQQVAVQWLSVRLDTLGAVVMFFMGALAVLSKQADFVPAGFLALGLSYAIQMITLLKYAVTVVCTLEAQFNAVQRVRHYGCNLDTEESVPIAKTVISEGKEGTGKPSTGGVTGGDVEMQLVPTHEPMIQPPADWPVTGSVVFDNVQMRYRDGPLVLKGVSFGVNGGEKIGIAGRTG